MYLIEINHGLNHIIRGTCKGSRSENKGQRFDF